MGQGWRELRYAPDRRHYLVVPTRLRDRADRCAGRKQRPLALTLAASHASLRPISRRIPTAPASVHSRAISFLSRAFVLMPTVHFPPELRLVFTRRMARLAFSGR